MERVPSSHAEPVAVDVDPTVGSHFLIGPLSAIAVAIRGVPGCRWRADHGAWVVPGLPRAHGSLSGVIAAHRGLRVSGRARALLDMLGELSSVADGVVHAVGGGRALVLVTAEDHAPPAALQGLAGVRRDARLHRWGIPIADDRRGPARAFFRRHREYALTPVAREALDAHEQPTLDLLGAPHEPVDHPACVVRIERDRLGEPRLRFCRRCHGQLEARLVEIGGRRLGRFVDAWWLPVDEDTSHAARQLVADLDVAAGVRAELDRLVLAHERRLAMEALSAAHDAEEPVGVEGLRPFQHAAVAYALRSRRCLIADEQGLGKTIEALATLEADGAFPAIVVCPASLKLNWQREARHWLPHRSVALLSGRRAGAAPVAGEIIVANYEIAGSHADALLACEPRALVLDESHFVKNPRAERTRAVRALADGLPEGALRLALSGTPVLNRPEELASQLRVLDCLDAVGGAERFNRLYARGEQLEQLHRRLRQTCMVRRRKADVLTQLPAKQRTVLPVELTTGDEYRRVEADVIRWLREQAEADERFLASVAELAGRERRAAIAARGREATQQARRAEALVRLNALKLIAAKGKLDAATEWIQAFVESGEKLVVFCHHREIARALLGSFPEASSVTGDDDPAERQASVDAFQSDPERRLIVCTLATAGVGITLTAASNVAFLELGWNPAIHDQAEDRCHRIGQRDQVTAWYLLAAGTIDEKTAELIERKRAIVAAASDGAPIADGDSVLGELTAWLTGESASRSRFD